MNCEKMDVPLMSQDEFFRHLDLRSVHASSAKYHYRQALKERLRASSQSKSILAKKDIVLKSPALSPVKWLTPKTCKQMFGRPKIRQEKRVLDFDNNNDDDKKPLLINSLLNNCHVLRHPGIRSEVQAKIRRGLKLNIHENEHWQPRPSCILDRKTYWKPAKTKTRRKKHKIHIRVQPAILEDQTRRKLEQKMSAALALYHFYKPKRKNGDILSFVEFTKTFVSNGQNFICSTFIKNSVSVPLKKLTNQQLKKSSSSGERLVSTETTVVAPTVKTSYGRQVKPVLAPIQIAKKVEQSPPSSTTCLGSAPLLDSPAKKLRFSCDICYRRFDKRTRMIRHYKNVHSSDIHKVDLSKFVLPKKFNPRSWPLIEL